MSRNEQGEASCRDYGQKNSRSDQQISPDRKRAWKLKEKIHTKLAQWQEALFSYEQVRQDRRINIILVYNR